MINRDSALYWFPKIHAAGLPVPKTIFVLYNHFTIFNSGLDELTEEYGQVYWGVYHAAEQLGLPAFLRTDLSSAKHDGIQAWKISDLTDLNRQLGATLEHNELKTSFERVKPQAMMVREFLNLRHEFTAFNGLPIAKEFRLFTNEQSRVTCAHPYWPKAALQGHLDTPVIDWERHIQFEYPEDSGLRQMAEIASKTCQGAWSIDFAEDMTGKWWLTDMATALNSYHYEGCPKISLDSTSTLVVV